MAVIVQFYHLASLMLVRVKDQRSEARGGSHDRSSSLFSSPSKHSPVPLCIMERERVGGGEGGRERESNIHWNHWMVHTCIHCIHVTF